MGCASRRRLSPCHWHCRVCVGRKCEKGAEGSLGLARQKEMSQPTKQRGSGLSRRGRTQVYLSPALAMSRAAVSTGEAMLQKQIFLKSQNPTKTKVNFSLLVRVQRGSAGTLLTMVTQEPGWWRLCLEIGFHGCQGWAAGMGMAHCYSGFCVTFCWQNKFQGPA